MTDQNHNESGWATVYRLGAIAAWLAVLVFRRNLSAEMDAFDGFGLTAMPTTPPITVTDWFDLLNRCPLLGLVLLDLWDWINYGLVGLLLTAVYGALRRANHGIVTLALAIGLIGVTSYLATYPGFALLNLSRQYAITSSDVGRLIPVTAGEALLATHNPILKTDGIGLPIALPLVTVAGLLISTVIWRSDVFSRATAVIGCLANGLLLLGMLFLPFAPLVYGGITALTAPLRIAWYVMLAVQLWRLAKTIDGNEQ